MRRGSSWPWPRPPAPPLRRRAAERGVAAIELALIVVVSFALFPLVLWFGRAFYEYNVLLKGSDAASRYLTSLSLVEVTTGATWMQAVSTATQMIGGTATGAGLSAAPYPIQIGCYPGGCGTPVAPPTSIELIFTLLIADELLFDTTEGAFVLEMQMAVPYEGR